MQAFIGTVPFTIIEAVNFVIENNIDDADLYLVKVFKGADEVYENLKKTKIFKNVYMVEDVLLTYPITLKKCIRTIRNGALFKKSTRGRKYDRVYYNNSGWVINSIFYTAFRRENKDLRNIFLEHGYYSYTNDYADKPWYLRFLIGLIGLKCMDGSMLDELHMFHPELMHMRHDGEIIKMPPMNRNNKRLVDALNMIFGYEEAADEFLDKDIIIMEQGPQKFDFDKEAFWERVMDILDKDRTIVKAHPRQKESTLQGCGAAVSKNHTLPWEVEAFNINIESKYQITIFSGACISPKLIFDEEPTVIFLYKLLPVDCKVWGESLVRFADDIGSIYRDKGKYFIPDSFEEFEEYCKKHNIARN